MPRAAFFPSTFLFLRGLHLFLWLGEYRYTGRQFLLSSFFFPSPDVADLELFCFYLKPPSPFFRFPFSSLGSPSTMPPLDCRRLASGGSLVPVGAEILFFLCRVFRIPLFTLSVLVRLSRRPLPIFFPLDFFPRTPILPAFSF